jgi:pyruvate,water dikinase
MNRGKSDLTYFFSNLDPEKNVSAGGKGRYLTRLYKLGFPVPNGFIIMPNGFDGDKLKDETKKLIENNLKLLSVKNKTGKYAIRSSAIEEDSEQASFAGEFETVLGVITKNEVLQAIEKVHKSRQSNRVKSYYQQINKEENEDIAVIVQELINPTFSGVIFTADPITGNRSIMVGNYIHGLGEKLVGGKENPLEFTFNKQRGSYSGPSDLKKKSKNLFQLATKLETLFGPQDIEFAITKNKVFILQTRPITTLKLHNPLKGEWNFSLLGDFLWSSTNSSEAFSEVMTPLTWSVFSYYYEKTTPFKAKKLPSSIGNIGGRLYFNYSVMFSILSCAFGQRRALNSLEMLLGEVPKELGMIPTLNISVLKRIRIGTSVLRKFYNVNRIKKEVSNYLEKYDTELERSINQIEKTETLEALKFLWKTSFEPAGIEGYKMVLATGGDVFLLMSQLSEELSKLLNEADINILLSHLGGKNLASLGPLIGLSKVKRGEISKEEYYEKYGHRGYAEGEFSIPRPREIPNWLEEQLQIYSNSELNNITKLMSKQEEDYKSILEKLYANFPKKAKKIEKKLEKLYNASITREEVRSKTAKAAIPLRLFLTKIGKLTGLQDDIYFLTLEEMIEKRDYEDLKELIEKRKEIYHKQKSIEPYPTFIRGFFDPNEWINNPDRRTDVFNSYQQTIPQDYSEVITGFPGAAGIREGVVRFLKSPEEGHMLKTGEILVARATNIGWTILFPKVSAIITDIGAPLSHAAIVARELGIPAVVGCRNATMRLRTGMRVKVDGEKGMIHILKQST